MKRVVKLFFVAAGFVLLVQSCGREVNNAPVDPSIELDTPFSIVLPESFPVMPVPANNPLTKRGVELGRMLFYDPILSSDSTISCASCHRLDHSFTDPQRFSTGVNGQTGIINAMAIINLAWQDRFFWNGRASSLEMQALEPINNPIEMHETSANVAAKLKRHPVYSRKFKAAFGTGEVTAELVAKALAQFERTVISSNAPYDRFYWEQERAFKTADEFRGFLIFSTERGQCFHCHGAQGTLFAHNLDTVFRNNGLLTNAELPGKGLGGFTGRADDDGLFKVPTLRNVEFTAPYMHDGRFQTLEEVVNFYSSNIHLNRNIDINFSKIGEKIEDFGGLNFSAEEKRQLIAFLKTLSDTSFLHNPAYSNPFK